jgi:hypothetical protein
MPPVIIGAVAPEDLKIAGCGVGLAFARCFLVGRSLFTGLCLVCQLVVISGEITKRLLRLRASGAVCDRVQFLRLHSVYSRIAEARRLGTGLGARKRTGDGLPGLHVAHRWEDCPVPRHGHVHSNIGGYAFAQRRPVRGEY